MGDYTNCGDKKWGGCNDADINKVMGWLLIYSLPPRDVDRPRTSGSRATVDWAGDLPPL